MSMVKAVALVVSLNIFLYFGLVIYSGGAAVENSIRFQGDIFDIYLSDSQNLYLADQRYINSLDNDSENLTYSFTLTPNGSWQSLPSDGAGQPNTPVSGTFSFLDSIRMIRALVVTLLNIGILPFTLFSMAKLPSILIVMVGIPFCIIYYVILIGFFVGRNT